ncbi:MAG: hypothetical protein R3E91_02760 [Chlamydiales bacterium]
MNTKITNVSTNSQLTQTQRGISKKHIIIVTLALVAIGMLITGSLAIIASFPNHLPYLILR